MLSRFYFRMFFVVRKHKLENWKYAAVLVVILIALTCVV